MDISIDTFSATRHKGRLWIIPVFEGRTAGAVKSYGLHTSAIRGWGFNGRKNQIHAVRPTKGRQDILLVGAGKVADWTAERARMTIAAALRHDIVRDHTAISAVFIARDLPTTRVAKPELIEALTEAAALSVYRFTKLKGKGETLDSAAPNLQRLTIAVERVSKSDRLHCAQASTMAHWTNWARDLLLQSQSHVTAVTLASIVRHEAARLKKVRCTVLGPREIAARKMGLLVAVNKGSAVPARFIILEYNGGRKGAAPICLVGKGLTYDTGGYNIKPGDSMRGMHMDKGGGVGALASLFAIAEMGLKINAVCLVPATDNCISGAAMVPGDVFVGASGISVEVDNTDAEGRLVLADALAFAERYRPTHIIDVATLTGAAVVALGDQATAVFSNDDHFAEQLLGCAQEAGELAWRMPLWGAYESKLKSTTADVKNIGGRWGGSITAALFLQRFVPNKVKWCHLDIAGRMRAESDQGYYAAGLPYGVGPRMLGRWARSL